MIERFRWVPFFLAVLCLLLIPTLASAQATIKVNDNVNFKFGLLLQAWADSAEIAASPQGYANNLFLRRIRFLIGGQITPTVSFFYETDNPNLGKAPKTLGSGFITQDAFVEWKALGATNNSLNIDAGLMLPPLCRNCLESAASLLSLDYGSFSFVESTPTTSSVGRDTGVLAKGYFMKNHLEYRAGVFQGFRRPGSRNAFRGTGRLQYNFWDTEAGYVYPGVYLGNKKILSVGAGADHQNDYRAWSADVFLSLPNPAKNALNGELTVLRFDGGTGFFTTPIPRQNDGTIQVGYYLAAQKVMPWARYERQNFSDPVQDPNDNSRWQAGVTWYPNGHNFNVKGAYSHVTPRVGNSTNQYTAQIQYFYY
ncbi:MAG TPA: hypothetical protein VEO74_01255 [Thermoanaerobaculia bacterium]|nr:hypothetical protein [Thermoanaerobaculia bacterium]